ncbi:hypothetical protein CP968_21015 [Streptomyces subrutilus]|uniref:Uncharacterized protein n=1 Tax=Streptomyces subrutilus TaxID=36818 RepID=A0A5P2UQ47_9ACTN|nr:hypothetical protein CP968_21015 [Streptomyces subrutilus]
MTVDGLTTPPPLGNVAVCVKCHRRTTAPVPVRCIESTSGPGTTLRACPDHAATVPHGPMPGEPVWP